MPPRLAVIAVVAALCAGCGNDSPSTPKTSAPPSGPASAPTSPALKPKKITVVLLSSARSDGETVVVYRPAKIRHVSDGMTEGLKVTATGPAARLPLAPHPRILLCTPLNEGRSGSIVNPEPVPPATLVAALRRSPRLLPDIGFDMKIGADGRISYLKQYYRP